MLKAMQTDVYTDFNGLAQLKTQARQNQTDAIEKVAGQFEAIFLGSVLKSMRQAKLADGVFDSQQSEFYRDMFDQQLALHLAGKPGIGLAKLIASQLSPNQPSKEESLQLHDYRQSVLSVASDHSFPTSNTSEAVKRSDAKTSVQGPEQFVATLRPLAERAATELGVDANVLLAQAALETGWGKHVIKQADGKSSYNLFNIKAGNSWPGKQAVVPTLEYAQGGVYQEKAAFRAYDSFAESFNDYVQLLKSSPRYQQALQHAADPKAYLQSLQQAGYATDPEYANKVDRIVHSKVLTDV